MRTARGHLPFYSYEDYKEQIADGTAAGGIRHAGKADARETVVSEITFSERMGNVYCIGIGVPVSKDGKFRCCGVVMQRLWFPPSRITRPRRDCRRFPDRPVMAGYSRSVEEGKRGHRASAGHDVDLGHQRGDHG